MLRRTFLAMFAVLAMAASANAGTMYAWLVIDPATTAGAGVPGAGGFSVTSNRSGPGSWHLFAVDDTTDPTAGGGNNGIKSFFVKLNPGSGGTIGANSNRSPTAQYDDDATFGNGNGPFVIGFDSNRTTFPSYLGGAQGNTVDPSIGGFGRTPGNFVLSKTGDLPPALSYNGTTSGQWGIYSAGDGLTAGIVAASGNVRNALFLGEGLYTGAPPVVDIVTTPANGGTIINSWRGTGFPNNGAYSTASDAPGNVLNATNPFIPEPATLTLVGLAIVGFSGLIGRRRS